MTDLGIQRPGPGIAPLGIAILLIWAGIGCSAVTTDFSGMLRIGQYSFPVWSAVFTLSQLPSTPIGQVGFTKFASSPDSI